MTLARLEALEARVKGNLVYRAAAALVAAAGAGSIVAGAVTQIADFSTSALIAIAAGVAAVVLGAVALVVLSRPPLVSIVPQTTVCSYQGHGGARPPSLGVCFQGLVTNHTGRPLIIRRVRLCSHQLVTEQLGLTDLDWQSMVNSIDDGASARLDCWFSQPLGTSTLLGTGQFRDSLEVTDQDNRTYSTPVSFTEFPAIPVPSAT
jgi:hypothetical protein